MRIHKVVNAELPVIFFMEGKKYIAYSPALDLSTCGDTFEQVRERFNEAVDIFFEELLKMGTLEDVLQEYGWERVLKPHKQWIPPHVIGQVQEQVKVPVGF
jgi:predicted RNase H-like HicB family nuclease